MGLKSVSAGASPSSPAPLTWPAEFGGLASPLEDANCLLRSAHAVLEEVVVEVADNEQLFGALYLFRFGMQALGLALSRGEQLEREVAELRKLQR